ncbi:MAG: rhodanese-like domain-containing protein [Phycisphaerales bacterium]|jgi:rhodanese-related sulfurtransferase|nr:rhodanese-like domain-containing protein [Phycisphaerales bacterium]
MSTSTGVVSSWPRALTQACAIGALAIALGAVHAAWRPVQLSLRAETPVTPPVAPPVTPPVTREPAQPTQPAAPAVTPVATTPKVGTRLSIDEIRAMMQAEPVQFVDARNASEFARGHLPGAVLLTPDMFATGLPPAALALDRGAPVIVYCTGGDCHSSELVAIRLQGIGYSRLFVYEGGYDAWKAAGMAVQMPDGSPGGGNGGGQR